MFARFVQPRLFSIRRSVHVEAKIEQLGYKLAVGAAAPKGVYLPFTRNGNTLYLAGHLPLPAGGSLICGRLGENMSIEEGQHAARMAALSLLSTIKAAVGDLDKVKKVVKLVGFVNSAPTFTNQPQVMNGCSELMGAVFGEEVGAHARSAVGVNVLPLGVAVEIEAIIEVHP